MNISMSAVMTAFSPAKPDKEKDKEKAGGPAMQAAAGLMELGLEAQLINKDTKLSNEVKQAKLAALSAKAKDALSVAMTEVESDVKSDQIESTKDTQIDPETAPTGDEAADGADGVVNGDTAQASDGNVAAAPASDVRSPAVYTEPPRQSADTTDNERVKGAMVDVHV